MKPLTVSPVLLLALSTTSQGQKVEGSKYDKPNGGPPASYFAASPTVPVSALQAAAAKASSVPALAKYPISLEDNGVRSTIHSDWVSFDEGAAYSWLADMDVDCDGTNHNCDGNPDGQSATNWGALSAYEVPFIVIPDEVLSANKDALPGNNVAAVICDGKMFYGILGDTNGDSPQVTGEASWVLARACFPNDNLKGSAGHNAADVTYIVFTGKDAVLPSSALNKNYITDFEKLRSMGDKLTGALVSNLGLKHGGSSPSTMTTSAAGSKPTSTSTCSDSEDCSGEDGKCKRDCDAETSAATTRNASRMSTVKILLVGILVTIQAIL